MKTQEKTITIARIKQKYKNKIGNKTNGYCESYDDTAKLIDDAVDETVQFIGKNKVNIWIKRE